VLQFVLNKIVYGLSILLGVVSLVFFLFNQNSDRTAQMLAGQFSDEVTLANIKKELYLDQSLSKQYLLYLNDLSPISVHSNKKNTATFFQEKKYTGFIFLNTKTKSIALKTPYLRRSYQSKKPVTQIISETVPNTIILALISIGIACFLGIGLGVFSALKVGSWLDQSILFFSVLGMAAPSFFAAILISYLGGYYFTDTISISWLFVICVAGITAYLTYLQNKKKEKWFTFVLPRLLLITLTLMVADQLLLSNFQSLVFTIPGTGLSMTGSLYSIHPFKGEVLTLGNLILPALTLGIRPLGVLVQLTRNSVLEVLNEEYVLFATSKGLSQRTIMLRHVLPNALNPVVTAISGWFASMLAGAVFVEYIFGWRGLGLEVFEALEKEDLPVVMGAVLFFSCVFVVINILVDILYGVLDPRVKMA
jgi:peptide/nickel transport system permease protein